MEAICSTFIHVSGHTANVEPNASQASNARAWMLSLLAALINPLVTESIDPPVSLRAHCAEMALMV
jgi:hypothetical protein